MSLRMTVDQLEQMKTHELADLLANIVLVLRRMPDVPCTQLQQKFIEPEAIHSETGKKKAQGTTASVAEAQSVQATSLPSFTEEELRKKKVADLQKIVATLHIATSSKKKDDLITKILARQGQEHSEQFAIQHL
ncbi:MAG: hypothetical protein NVS2B2_33480 [Ktedonobacteraceae bacterium]